MSKSVKFEGIAGSPRESQKSLPPRLTAAKEGSFAYRTVRDRLPKILASVIDSLYREKDRVMSKHGKAGSEDLKEVTGRLSKLRYEMMTNKPIDYLRDEGGDIDLWTRYIDDLNDDETPSWFKNSWLFVECYMYRFVASACLQSKYMKDFDPFMNSKRSAFQNSLEAIKTVMNFMSSAISTPPTSDKETKTLVFQFLELSLWANKCDLSISAGTENSQTVNPLTQLGKLDENILVNNLSQIWEHLVKLSDKVKRGESCQIDIILDNAGFELIADICLAEILILIGAATQVVFHVKSLPWFVSDTTTHDITYTIQQLQSANLLVKNLHAAKWIERGSEGTFKILENDFWTTSYDFPEMIGAQPKLYKRLSQSDLLIFKGDLNYRKLLGDRAWPFDISFQESLNGFHPSDIVALRTLKSDVCSALNQKTVERLNMAEKDWMETGKYGLIQFCVKPSEVEN